MTWYESGMQVFDRSEAASPTTIVVVAVGGMLGALGRWAVSGAMHVTPGDWPWPTLAVNVVGALAIGFAARRYIVDSRGWAFLATGVLGGFTTFSTFAVELNRMVDADRVALAVAYGAITLGAGIGATLVAGRRTGS